MGTIVLVLLLLVLLGVPIAYSLIAASLFAIVQFTALPVEIAPQRMVAALDSFPLLAIPFFILAGSLMSSGGIARRLIELAKSFVGHFTGGVALVLVVTTMLFAAMSGSGSATVASVGAIMIPAMIKSGYSRHFAGAKQAVAGELGVILPPSIPIILFGVAASVSIGDLFVAGVVPGLMIGASLIIYAYFYSKKRKIGGGPKATWAERRTAFRRALFALFMPVIVLGGIYAGIATPTEAAAFAVLYAFIVGLFVYREIRIRDLPKIFAESAVITAMIMIVIAAAGLFGWLLTQARIPQEISSFITANVNSAFVFLLLVNLFLLVLGMFFEAGAAILILAPILTPIAVSYGIDPVQFGIIMVVNLAIGMVTPPVGVNLFIAAELSKSKLEQITKPLMPLVLVMIFDLLLITYVPPLTLWLPSLSG